MFFSCKLCSKETVVMTHLCAKCTRVRHLISIYGDSVYSVLENVLVTDAEREKEICKTELKKEIGKKFDKMKHDSDTESDSD